MSHARAATALLCALILWTGVAAGEDAIREQWIERIEAQYMPAKLPAADSPIITSMIDQAKKANPTAPTEIWPIVQSELAASFREVVFGRGSAAEGMIRHALEPMSVDDMQRLSKLLDDPLYKQFTAAMSDPAAQKEAQTAMMKVGLQLGPVFNEILTRHQLRGVY